MATLLTFPDDTLPPSLDAQVRTILRTEWPSPHGDEAPRSLNDPRTNPILMVLVEDEVVLSYLAIPSKVIHLDGDAYKAYGLSSVITNQGYRHHRYGSQIVIAARRFIAAGDADIGIFTCDLPLVDFYVRCGWTLMEHTAVIGGTREKPFPADPLSKRTLMGFFSEKAMRHRADFEGASIYLELREGDLW
jgi:hypothetical protein